MQTHIANIGPRGRRRRALTGIAAIGVGLVAAAVLVATRVAPGWLFVLFAPFWLGALGIVQAREGT